MLPRAIFAALALAMIAAPASAKSLFEDVTQTHLPAGVTDGLSMDARAADIDADGDLDIVVATEWRPNILLINDGTGRFSHASGAFENLNRDSEDIWITDFDGDGNLDVIIVSEDDQVNELYFGKGDGSFDAVHDRLPRTDTTNDVLVADFNGDGAPDIMLGNNGQNSIMINTGDGHFIDETASRLPVRAETTQDLHLGDIDGDGDQDLLEGNEGNNRLLLNDGSGRFTDAPDDWLPLRDTVEETREADLGDIDGDGDLDIIFANVRFFQQTAERNNRLLVNDGTGRFTDVSSTNLPADNTSSPEVDFVDLDGDGDLDIIFPALGNVRRERSTSPWHVYRNDGTGQFEDATAEFLPSTAVGNGFDALAADFNGDGLLDLYLANRIGPDVLLLRRP